MTMRLTAFIILAALTGCTQDDVSEPGWQRGLAVTDPARSSVQMIEAPMTVQAGVPFTVTVRSLGSSNCTRLADAVVVVNGLYVDITPYNEYARTAPDCTADQHVFEHRVSVTVSEVGEARLRLHARSLTGQPLSYDILLPVRS